MTDFKYEEPEMVSWWVKTWVSWVTKYGVDGFRLDGPNGVAYQSDTLQTWDLIAAGAAAAGHPIAVFGEVHRYHFSEHDASAPSPQKINESRQDLGKGFANVAATKSAVATCAAQYNGAPGKGGQYETMMFSCHDAGWTGYNRIPAVHSSSKTCGSLSSNPSQPARQQAQFAGIARLPRLPGRLLLAHPSDLLR